MTIKLTERTYIHTCENNNGIVHVNKGEAIIVSTPDSDAETQNFIDWTKQHLHAEIIGYVIDRWHPDAMEGLDVVKKSGIKTYSYELTRTIAKEKGLPIPEIGFDPKIESPLIQHNVTSKRIDSDYGRLQIFYKEIGSNKPVTDIYYNGLTILKQDDEVGYIIIVREMIR